MASAAHLPVVVIGAGPTGLAAAARLDERGLPFVVIEQAAQVAASPRAWRHVRLFSHWRYNIDEAAERLLLAVGWERPDLDALPTGHALTADYLEPLAAHPRIAPHLVLGGHVIAVSRERRDKMSSVEREDAPLVVRWSDSAGAIHRTRARAVIDASGTGDQPNPMGVDGLPVEGEGEASDRIVHAFADVLGAARADYDGQRTLVVGSGHSAINVVLDLVRLKAAAPTTEILWALRRGGLARLRGGGLDDQLPERGALGLAVMDAIKSGKVRVLAPFAADRIERTADGVTVEAQLDGAPTRLEVDRVVVATGFRPNLDMLREVRVSLDPIVEAPMRLAPLIDPNLHSCGTVPPHGAEALSHPEPGLYVVGAKSYGRAPTFLMATGYEQVRSVVAEIDGDHEAARDVRLVLPETGVCSVSLPDGDAASLVDDGGCAPARCCGAAA